MMHKSLLKTSKEAVGIETHVWRSVYLEREMTIDCYLPTSVEQPGGMSLLLINDGQNLEELGLKEMLSSLFTHGEIRPVLCVGIHAGDDRKFEYGVAHQADYLGRGNRAALYRNFIVQELLPFIYKTYRVEKFQDAAFAGFSLGGLTALDLVWNHPHLFQRVGVFSGSLWWRSRDLEDGYVEERDRIMHAQVEAGVYKPGLKFFFETGTQDETADRNRNGIIDSIDDTLNLIELLVKKGYHLRQDLHYLELADGKHDVATWARAMPDFLRWGWGPQPYQPRTAAHRDQAK